MPWSRDRYGTSLHSAATPRTMLPGAWCSHAHMEAALFCIGRSSLIAPLWFLQSCTVRCRTPGFEDASVREHQPYRWQATRRFSIVDRSGTLLVHRSEE